MALISDIVDIFTARSINTEIICASTRNSNYVTEATKHGADVATVPYSGLMQMIQHALTNAEIEKFLKEWNNLPFMR